MRVIYSNKASEALLSCQRELILFRAALGKTHAQGCYENNSILCGRQSGKANVAGNKKMADWLEIYQGNLGKEIAKVSPTIHITLSY